MEDIEFLKRFKAIKTEDRLKDLLKESSLRCPVCEVNFSNQTNFIGNICEPCFTRTVEAIRKNQEKTCDNCAGDCKLKNIVGECAVWKPKK
jgi:uncharacterized C2H2 Zn-finger protein